jgi:hypothetical protein
VWYAGESTRASSIGRDSPPGDRNLGDRGEVSQRVETDVRSGTLLPTLSLRKTNTEDEKSRLPISIVSSPIF